MWKEEGWVREEEAEEGEVGEWVGGVGQGVEKGG